MCFENIKPSDTAKDYILRHLHDIRYEHSRALERHFQPYGKAPKTLKEMKAWIKSGDYRVIEPKYASDDEEYDEDDEDRYFDWTDAFKWGKDKPDLKAYETAKKALEDRHQEVIDTVSILTDETTRLKVLRDYRTATFH